MFPAGVLLLPAHEISLGVRIYPPKPTCDALEAAYVRKSIRSKYQMIE